MIAGVDPATASGVWNSPIYTTGSVKFSSAVTQQDLLEGGFSTNYERYNISAQPGIVANAVFARVVLDDPEERHWDRHATGTTTTRPTQGMYPDRFAAAGSVSYVTGAHNIKVGVQDTWGRYRQFRSANGDLRAIFKNGTPIQATILNTPVNYQDNLKADLGVYAQDSWTLNRLTVNYGARVGILRERHPGRNVRQSAASTAARTFGPIDMPTWKSISPRGGVVYDLFGNQKTALKFSIGRYEQAGTTGFSDSYNPLHSSNRRCRGPT